MSGGRRWSLAVGRWSFAKSPAFDDNSSPMRVCD